MALIGGRGGCAEGAGCFSSSPALALAAAPRGRAAVALPAPQLPGPGPWLGAGDDGFVSFLAKLLGGFPRGKGLIQAAVRGQLRPAPRERNLGKKSPPGWCRAPRSREEMRTPLLGPRHQKHSLKNQRIPLKKQTSPTRIRFQAAQHVPLLLGHFLVPNLLWGRPWGVSALDLGEKLKFPREF